MSTTTTGALPPGGSTRRALIILDAARDATGRELTMLELATLCGRLPGHGFGRDLSLARHLALDEGERITECYWSKERKCHVLVHLHPGQEAGLGINGLLPHGADVTTRARTLHRHAEWEAKNAESALDREIAVIARHMGAGVAEFGEAFGRMAAVVREAKQPPT